MISFSVTHSSTLPNIGEIINKHWHILKMNNTFGNVCKETPVITFSKNALLDKSLVQTQSGTIKKLDTLNQRHSIKLYLSKIEDELLKISEDWKNYLNLSKDNRSALQDLMKEKSIIIKPTDTGSATVIWNREDYVKESNEQLSIENVYGKYNEFPAVQLNKQIRSTFQVCYLRKK